ncbi:MAG: hypothetical protein K6A67_08190 [Bacteroidales bacterium]|nr:hypothetical protein [Bacteroidales bacterium]
MKKCILLFAAVFFCGICANAQQGSGSMGSLTVNYYNHGSKTGHLIFNNQTETTLSKAHVKVTVLITWNEHVNVPYVGEVPQKTTKTLVLCDDDFYNIPKGESKVTSSGRGPVKGGPEKQGKTYQYNVEVECQVPFPGSSGSSTSQTNYSASSSDGELITRGEVLHAMYKSTDDPAPSRITVDVYRTSDGKYYANMTSPETISKMSIFKLTGSVYNGYVKYQNNSYGILINDSRW